MPTNPLRASLQSYPCSGHLEGGYGASPRVVTQLPAALVPDSAYCRRMLCLGHLNILVTWPWPSIWRTWPTRQLFDEDGAVDVASTAQRQTGLNKSTQISAWSNMVAKAECRRCCNRYDVPFPNDGEQPTHGTAGSPTPPSGDGQPEYFPAVQGKHDATASSRGQTGSGEMRWRGADCDEHHRRPIAISPWRP